MNPGLAERWEATDGNTMFIFHLRRGARWSDGRPITADDFVYTLRRGLTPELARATPTWPTTSSTPRPSTKAPPSFATPARAEFLFDENPSRRRLVVPGRAEDRAAQLDAGLQRRIQGSAARCRCAPRTSASRPSTTTRFASGPCRRCRSCRGCSAHQFFRWFRGRRSSAMATPGRGRAHRHQRRLQLETLEALRPDRRRAQPDVLGRGQRQARADHVLPDRRLTTMMNLYKAGEVDAIFNHTVPVRGSTTSRG